MLAKKNLEPFIIIWGIIMIAFVISEFLFSTIVAFCLILVLSPVLTIIVIKKQKKKVIKDVQ